MMTNDPMALAAEAGLRYVEEGAPGYRRIRRGKGFTYVGPDGERVDGAARERIEQLVIPPAWKQVWISADTSGHIQATGYDTAGRKQYIYHPVWEASRDEVKFERMGEFGARVSALRKRVDADLRLPGLPLRRVVALAVAVLDRTLIRVGNSRYVDANDSYGLTTLTPQHVAVEGRRVHLEFEGKGGVDRQVAFRDRRLASLISECRELAGQTLFSYRNGQGPAAITSTHVNGYLADSMRGHFTAKDFRTWGATASVVTHLACDGERDQDREKRLLEAIDVAAERLGNSREVCRSSYLHPAVPEAFLDGRLEEVWRRSRSGRWIDRAESALNQLVQANPA